MADDIQDGLRFESAPAEAAACRHYCTPQARHRAIAIAADRRARHCGGVLAAVVALAGGAQAIAQPGLPMGGGAWSSHADRAVVLAALDESGLSVENVSGPAGDAIPLKIQIGKYDSEQYSFLMIRGLPKGFTLSAGFRLKDRWAVSLRDVGKLTVSSPPSYQGDIELEVLLVRSQDKPVERHVMTLSVAGQGDGNTASAPEALANTASVPLTDPRSFATIPPVADQPVPRQPESAAAAPAQVEVSPAVPDVSIAARDETATMERASAMIENGDIASARLLLEHIAKKGSGRGAMMLAQTYDPAFLSSINTLGLKPNPENARKWYAVAAQLGQEAARERLSALSK